jgi:hypothetical protein
MSYLGESMVKRMDPLIVGLCTKVMRVVQEQTGVTPDSQFRILGAVVGKQMRHIDQTLEEEEHALQQ